jgi:hypothetical protein
MRSLFTILAVFIFIIGCNQPQLKGVDYYKTGTFKTVLKDKKSTFSIAERNDSIQVETYEGKKDTFLIKWKSNFEYILLKKNPKNALDSTPFHVKITKFDGDSYQFKAFYKGSNFKQEGTATKTH